MWSLHWSNPWVDWYPEAWVIALQLCNHQNKQLASYI